MVDERVSPSGRARRRVAPMVPPAPGRLSTMTGLPSTGASRLAMTRARMSRVPPGVKGETMVTVPLG
jgi:hypothetical protein